MSFQGLLWALVLAVILFLCVVPLARNLWAYYTWDRVPCWQGQDFKNHFFFERDGVAYYGDCRNFWDGLEFNVHRATGQEQLGAYNSECYVSRGTPMHAVAALDTYKDLDGASPSIVISAVLVVVALVLTRAVRKRPAQPGGGAAP